MRPKGVQDVHDELVNRSRVNPEKQPIRTMAIADGFQELKRTDRKKLTPMERRALHECCLLIAHTNFRGLRFEAIDTLRELYSQYPRFDWRESEQETSQEEANKVLTDQLEKTRRQGEKKT